jgi:hypothetical protein
MSIELKALISVALLLAATAGASSAKDLVEVHAIPRPPMAADPPRPVSDPLIEGEITAPKALRAIYGNYDPETDSAGWLVNFGRVIMGNADSDEEPELLPVKRLSDQVVPGKPGHERYLLLTSLGWPRGQSFRPMHTPVGGAIFERARGGWRLAWSRRFIDELGDDQSPPGIVEPVYMGQARWGFVVHSTSSGMGFTDGALTVITDVNGELKEVLMLWFTSGENGGDCILQKHDCYRYNTTLSFRFAGLGGNQDYYDILRITSGTYRSSRQEPIHWVENTKRYVFRQGQYQQAP